MPLAADRNTQMKDGELIAVPVAANAKIYAGALMVANAAGYAAPGSAAFSLIYLGRAEESVDNTGGLDGAKTVLVRRGKAFKYKNSGADAVTQAELGRPCYIADDETVAKTSGGTRSVAGIVVGVEADGVWVAPATRLELSVAAALDFAAIAAAASADLTISVPGAAVGDSVSLGLPAAPAAGLIFQTFVSAAGTVTVRATNITAAAVEAASATYRATVLKA